MSTLTGQVSVETSFISVAGWFSFGLTKYEQVASVCLFLVA